MNQQLGSGLLGVGLSVVIATSLIAQPSAPLQDEVVMGHFVTTAAGAASGFNITGRAMLIRKRDGTTEVYTQVLGLQPNTAYPVHVHDLPCALGGGNHYKIDPTNPGTVPSNELWPDFTTDASGIGYGFASAQHLARPEAQSVVVHDTDNTRIACADLVTKRSDAVVTAGNFVTLPGGVALGYKIAGRAQMVRTGGTTWVTSWASGLMTGTAYPAHVHALPCGITDGGGHYKIDPTVTGTVRTNEIWPSLTVDSAGIGRGSDLVSHVARPEAQSVVIHAPDNTKIACADLTGEQVVPHTTSGTAITTATGLDRGFSIEARASLVRTGTGATLATLSVDGLQPKTLYVAHVHDMPCSLGGGAHYKIDPTIGGTIPSNEIWLQFKTDRRGAGRAVARLPKHLARPEAQSVVIHDLDGARIGCIDLQ